MLQLLNLFVHFNIILLVNFLIRKISVEVLNAYIIIGDKPKVTMIFYKEATPNYNTLYIK